MSHDDLPLWRRCEKAWADYLAANDFLVTILAEADHAGAPLIHIGDRSFRAPDVQATKAGQLAYWEVKQRNSASVNLITGDPEYWVSYDSFSDYYELARISGSPVRIILHDGEVWGATHKWLQAEIATVHDNGERAIRRASDGSEVVAWTWPAEVMTLVDGPDVALTGEDLVPSPDDDGKVPFGFKVIGEAAKELRRNRKVSASAPVRTSLPSGVFDLLRENSRLALDATRRLLMIPDLPRYSVMRIGLIGVDLEGLLGLMDYGIRVFIISEGIPDWGVDPNWIDACEQSRLLEWAVIEGADGIGQWVVDGEMSEDLHEFVSRAPSNQRYNHGQFVVVHRGHLDDVLVSAGAGTGKTETMSERILFLLATSSRHADPRDPEHVLRLRLDEIVLVTFTRDAAREMRERIARTLMLRQRLCEHCVLPTVAWMLELSNTEIETIHTYSKKLIQREGARIGFGPGFQVGEQLMDFYASIDGALSPHLATLYGEADNQTNLPAAHEFRDFVTKLWRKLSGNGFSPLGQAFGREGVDVDWGTPPDGPDGRVSEVVRLAIVETAKTFADLCVRNQTLPVSEIVATAARAIGSATQGLARAPRYVFVDEFQDTDSEQIGMIIDVRRLSDAKLFIVGDEKQGIYRFRGAEGNAFKELTSRAAGDGVEVAELTLSQNFRSGSRLLDSMHRFFAAWGAVGYLRYDSTSRLSAALGPKLSLPVSIPKIKKDSVEGFVLTKVTEWLTAYPRPDETVAILCRTNNQAWKYASLLKTNSISCETRVGGDFFRTPAVIDLRVFLEAVLNFRDDASLLELCTTRWFPGLASMAAPVELNAESRLAWGVQLPAMMTWVDRLSSFGQTGTFERSDLDQLRAKVHGLGELLRNRPVLGWLMDCDSWMQPRTVVMQDEDPNDHVERERYGRCFDHLVTMLDENFGDAPISPHGLLEWLRIKIATDETEDEPDPSSKSKARVTVVTVHKAKGLEYDRVLVPDSSSPFSYNLRTEEVAIVPSRPLPRLLWKWSPEGRRKSTNVSSADTVLWLREDEEKIREETRLLYVAMTRAREELEIVISPSAKPSEPPDSWAGLLLMGGLK